MNTYLVKKFIEFFENFNLPEFSRLNLLESYLLNLLNDYVIWCWQILLNLKKLCFTFINWGNWNFWLILAKFSFTKNSTNMAARYNIAQHDTVSSLRHSSKRLCNSYKASPGIVSSSLYVQHAWASHYSDRSYIILVSSWEKIYSKWAIILTN